MSQSDRQRAAQAAGYAFDRELARDIQGSRHVGSGNQVGHALDASGHTLVFSGKYVDAESFSVKEDDLDEALRATVGPEAVRSSMIPVLAAKFRSGRRVAVVDLDQLLEWVRRPPELIPTTVNENRRHTARTPPHLRD